MFTAFNEAERERSKLSEALTKSQDKAIRRISELREQSELDRLNKADLTNNFQTSIEEKDSEIEALKTQVNCLHKLVCYLVE